MTEGCWPITAGAGRPAGEVQAWLHRLLGEALQAQAKRHGADKSQPSSWFFSLCRYAVTKPVELVLWLGHRVTERLGMVPLVLLMLLF
ncbi:MAG: hypothetical protein A3E79_11515 [Burkholderiales bacterium RIFCSPHIGHO2_12_FULL_61_11]|nr:MAG: hypothetical protein A3E79_11515 [Burkholderiales bacterium RIFCSPHIGHO2_12_FULL_61_11]